MISFSTTIIRYVNKSSNNCSLRFKKNLVLIVVGTFNEDIANIMHIYFYEELAAHHYNKNLNWGLPTSVNKNYIWFYVQF